MPDDVVINDARLRLYLNFASPTDDEPLGTRLWRVDSPWDEHMLTWNRWIAEGIRGDGEGYDVQFIGTTEGWYEWEITDLVQEWYDGTHVNYGMLIIGDEEVQQRERAFFSRETPSAFYPQLVIDYATLMDDRPPVVTVDPLPEFVDRDFTVRWDGTDPGPAEIAYYDVQVRVDGGDWTDFKTGVDVTEAEFVGENGRFYEFRAREVDTVGNVEAFGDAEASTTVDTMLPSIRVNPLPRIIATPTFPVSWSGDDEGSGIASYDVLYRVNHGGWTTWLVGTTETSATFDVTTDDFPPTDGFYEFEARAVDNVGNQEGFAFAPEASAIVDAEAPFIVPRLWLPIIAHQ